MLLLQERTRSDRNFGQVDRNGKMAAPHIISTVRGNTHTVWAYFHTLALHRKSPANTVKLGAEYLDANVSMRRRCER